MKDAIYCIDNGPGFISKALDAWSHFNNISLDYSRPGTPTDNACIESFNGSFRDECLNTHWFMSLEDAKPKIEAWTYRNRIVSAPMVLGWRRLIHRLGNHSS